MIQIGTEKLPSVINDPFKKTKVTGASMFLGQRFNPTGGASGTIYFENGLTKGEQKFYAKDFDDLVVQMRAMLDNIE